MLLTKNWGFLIPPALYIATVVVANVLFDHASYPGMFKPLPDGSELPLASFLVGITFVARDYVQRSLGHWVLVCMALACVISFFMADPFVAVISAVAFAVSELADWALYTITKKPFHQRILVSSVISTPLDTIVFLWLLQQQLPEVTIFTVWSVGAMIASKLIAAGIVYAYYSHREEAAARA